MADMNFNLASGAVAARKMLILFLNTGTTAAPVWSPVGKRVEDSSAEYDWQEESKTDIFGETYTNAKPPIITQSFEPYELAGGDIAQQHIWNINVREQDTAKVTNQDLLVVHTYTGSAAEGAFAERYPNSMVKVSGLGGSSNVDMPIDCTFGGKRAIGTATVTGGTVTFTEDAA